MKESLREIMGEGGAERRLELARGKAAAGSAAIERGDWRRAADFYATAAAIADGHDGDLWRQCVFNRAFALREFGEQTKKPAAVKEAAELLETALLPRTSRAEEPAMWALVQASLGDCLVHIGEASGDADALRRAIVAHRAALEERSDDPDGRLRTLMNLGDSYGALWDLEPERAHLDAALLVFRAALLANELADTQQPRWRIRGRIGQMLLLIAGSYERQVLCEAVAAFATGVLEAGRSADPEDVGKAAETFMQVFGLLTEPAETKQILDDFADVFAFLDMIALSENGPTLMAAPSMAVAVEGTAQLRFSIDIGPAPQLVPLDCLGTYDRPVESPDGVLEALDPSRNEGRPPKVTGEVHEDQIETAEKLAARAEASGDRGDLMEQAVFLGAAAAAAAPVDADIQQTYLFGCARVLVRLGAGKPDVGALREAVHIYRRQLMPISSRAEVPVDWSTVQRELGKALGHIGYEEDSVAELKEAVIAFEKALQVVRREAMPQRWASIQNELGDAYRTLADIGGGCEREAQAAYDAALEVHTKAESPTDWARVRLSVGLLLGSWSERCRDLGMAEAALAALNEATAVLPAQKLATTRSLEGYIREVEATRDALRG